jgi:hypothetical protein
MIRTPLRRNLFKLTEDLPMFEVGDMTAPGYTVLSNAEFLA